MRAASDSAVSSSQHRHGACSDDRAGVELRRHEVHGAAADLHAVVQRLPLRVEPGNAGSSDGWMFSTRSGKRVEEAGAEPPHEAGQADDVRRRARRSASTSARRRPRGSASPRVRHDQRLDAGRPRALAAPARRARSRSRRAIVASSRPSGDGVDERLEVASRGPRPARRGGGPPAASSDIDDARRSPATTAPMTCTVFAGLRAAAADDAAASASAHGDDQPDAHVERAEHVVERHAARACRATRRAAAPATTPRRTSAAVPSGRMRGRLSVMPPPVMCAMPLTQAGRRAAAASRAGSERCGAQQRLADRLAELGDVAVDRQAERARRRSAAPASSRWCAGRPTAEPISTSPGTSAAPVDRARARSTAPTMKPATSYSPSA